MSFLPILEKSPNLRPRLLNKCLMLSVRQSLDLCSVYLLLGLGAELLRRQANPWGTVILNLLDSIPYLVLRWSGCLDSFLVALATGQLTPFLSRFILSFLSLLLVFLQAATVSLMLSLCLYLTKKKELQR